MLTGCRGSYTGGKRIVACRAIVVVVILLVTIVIDTVITGLVLLNGVINIVFVGDVITFINRARVGSRPILINGGIAKVKIRCQIYIDVVAVMGNGEVLILVAEINIVTRRYITGTRSVTIGTDVPALISRCIRGIGDIGGVIHTLISGIELRAINGIGAAIGDTPGRDIGDLTLITTGANTDDTAWISARILIGCTTDGAFGSRVGSGGGRATTQRYRIVVGRGGTITQRRCAGTCRRRAIPYGGRMLTRRRGGYTGGKRIVACRAIVVVVILLVTIVIDTVITGLVLLNGVINIVFVGDVITFINRARVGSRPILINGGIAKVKIRCQIYIDVVAVMGNGEVLILVAEINIVTRRYITGTRSVTIGTDVPALISRCIRGIGDIGSVIHTLISGIEL
ncbi:hypothetical protein LMG33818_001667 [Halomonadaceae bacterium LMG 33818]